MFKSGLGGHFSCKTQIRRPQYFIDVKLLAFFPFLHPLSSTGSHVESTLKHHKVSYPKNVFLLVLVMRNLFGF